MKKEEEEGAEEEVALEREHEAEGPERSHHVYY